MKRIALVLILALAGVVPARATNCLGAVAVQQAAYPAVAVQRVAVPAVVGVPFVAHGVAVGAVPVAAVRVNTVRVARPAKVKVKVRRGKVKVRVR